jgi:hypothetical protein
MEHARQSRRAITHVAVELIPVTGAKNRVTIEVVVTDQTGANRRQSVGEYDGPCRDVTTQAKSEPNAPRLGVNCGDERAGTRVRVIAQKNQLVVMRARIDEVTPADDPSYDAYASVRIPLNSRVITDYDR